MSKSGDRDSNKMAKIIQKRDKSDKILYLISWKEIVQMCIQSLLIVVYLLIKKSLVFIKSFFDKRIGATRQKFVRQFRVLSLNADSSSSNHKLNRAICYDNRSISPGTQKSELGEHKYIKIKNVRFHYVERGEENQRVVLLLHGFPDCFYGWRNQIGVLSQKHRVIALDLKGFNDSDRPMIRCHYKPERICYELKCFIDALQIKSLCIIGHDLGAIIGWIFTLKNPDYVNKFFSISTPHPNLFWNTAKGSTMSKYWFNMIQIPILPEKELYRDNSFIHEAHKHLINDVSSNEINRIVKYKENNLMETYEYIFRRPEDYTGALNYFRNLLLYRLDPSYYISCPCILVFGTENLNFKLDSAIKSAEYCENPLIKIIDGAGYWPHQTHASELNAILLKYLLREKKSDDECEEVKSSSPTRKGLVSRVMNKVYSVGQQYGI